MAYADLSTRFAPAERASAETVSNQSGTILRIPHLSDLYEAVSELVMILNDQRQIVYCNRSFAGAIGHEIPDRIYGLRPGEALKCVNACKTAAGCGTTEFCRTCGAVNAILESRKGTPKSEECRISRENGDALDLLVKATPLVLGDERYTVVAAVDISHEKRRRSLERIFFHDVLNIASSLRMLVELAQSPDFHESKEVADSLSKAVTRLIEEITSQKDLAAAERNELTVKPVEIQSRGLIGDLADIYGRYAANAGCRIVVAASARNVRFISDRTILSRVIGNMIKNAVEASGPGDTITINCRKAGGEVRFSVHNPGFIPRDVQLQLFQRSFSTKEGGRGLGTYSMKLLSERYLKGKVLFKTSRTEGTTFYASFPAGP